jgi:hypothetical protein
VRLRELPAFGAMKLENLFALARLPQPAVLRGRELPIFKGLKIAVPAHALGFVALADRVGLPVVVRFAAREGDGAAGKAAPPLSQLVEGTALGVVDGFHPLRVHDDGGRLIVPVAVDFLAVLGAHAVGLAAVFRLLIGLLALLTLDDEGLGALPDVVGARLPPFLIGGERGGLFPVLRLRVEVAAGEAPGLVPRVLGAPVEFLADFIAPPLGALLFGSLAGLGDAALGGLDRLGLAFGVGLLARLFTLLLLGGLFFEAVGASKRGAPFRRRAGVAHGAPPLAGSGRCMSVLPSWPPRFRIPTMFCRT